MGKEEIREIRVNPCGNIITMDIFFLHTDRHGLTRILLRASLQLVGKEEIIRERRVGNIKFL